MIFGRATVTAVLAVVASSASVSLAFVVRNPSRQTAARVLQSTANNHFQQSLLQEQLRQRNSKDGEGVDDEDASQSVNTDMTEDAVDKITTPEVDHDDNNKEKRASLTNDLLRSASSTGRGEFATDEERYEMADTIFDLENLSPTSEPTLATHMIEGTWDLLYSDTQLFRSSPFFMAGRAVCETQEQADQYDWFCDMHRAALAISNIGKVRQIISSDRMVSEFETKVGAVPFLSDFTPFSYSGGLPTTIDGAIVSSADIVPTAKGKGWEIFMDTVEIKGSNIPLLRQVLDGGLKLGSRDLGRFLEDNMSSYTNPKPVFETTYLDESMRISRDQDGKVFVYGKVSDSTEPTSYDAVAPDLGIGKLLQGVFKFGL